MEVTTNNYDITDKINCANCRHFISASCFCFMYRNPLQFFIFTLSLKHHSEDLFTIIFRSSIIHRGLPPQFCMRIVFDFFLGISSHHKRDWRQFAYAKFLGVNKVFYGQCENGEYVNNFYLYIYFLISQIKNVRSTFLKISFVQSPFKNCLALLFFFSSGFEINLYMRKSSYTVNSPLQNTS